MSLKKKKLEEQIEKRLAKTNEQNHRQDASVKSILQRFRNIQSQPDPDNNDGSPAVMSPSVNAKTTLAQPLPDLKPDLKSEPRSDVKIVPSVDQRPEPKIEASFDQRIDPIIDQRIDQRINSNIAQNFETNTDLKSDLKPDLADQKDQLKIENLATLKPANLQPGFYNPAILQPGQPETMQPINQAIVKPGQIETRKVNYQANEQPGQLLARLVTSPGYRMANFIDDDIIPTLSLAEQSVLRRIYRLSIGFNRLSSDSVSLSKIAEKCNLSVAGVKSAIKSLQMKNLIRVSGENKYDPKGGNKYEIVIDPANPKLGYIEAGLNTTQVIDNQVNKIHSNESTRLSSSYIKDHDHDDVNMTDHHQGEVMKIYQKLTGNQWSKNDERAYDKIRGIGLEVVEQAIKITIQRATTRPNSLNYFIKEIINLAQPTKQGRQTQKRALEKIVNNIRTRLTGSNYSYSDFIEDIKRQAVREGVSFDPDLLNEVLEK